MVTASPQPIVMLVKPPCTISPGAPVPNSTTMATTPSPNKMRTRVPKNSAINSGSMLGIGQPEFYRTPGGANNVMGSSATIFHFFFFRSKRAFTVWRRLSTLPIRSRG